MTDEFISDKTSEQNTGGQPQGDNQQGNGEGVDTKIVEYQLSQLQKRVEDKDAYIKQLENEGKTFRESLDEYEQRLKTTEELTKLLEQSGNQQAQSGGSNQETALDENTVAEKVIQTLSKREAEEQMNKNWAQVESRVMETFGNDAKSINEKMKQIAEDNGMSVSDMKETARKSPKAFYKLAGLEGGQQRPQSPQPSRGSVQNVDYENSQKDLAYYNNLMRTNWREYMKPHNQREYRKLLLEQNNQS